MTDAVYDSDAVVDQRIRLLARCIPLPAVGDCAEPDA